MLFTSLQTLLWAGPCHTATPRGTKSHDYRSLTTAILIISVIIFTAPSCQGRDPVLSPEIVTDSHGNTADADSAISWAALPEGKPYETSTEYNDGGLTPLYNFAKHFVNTVQSNEFPYEIVEGLVDNGNYLSANSDKVIDYELGFIVCFALGLVFVLVMPIVGLIFCLCRLCGNCGGKMEQKGKASSFWKFLFIFILAVLTLFIGVGMICSYVNNERMEVALEEIGNNVETNTDDLSNYLDNTIEEFKFVASENFNFTRDVINRDLDNIGYLVGIPVRESLRADTHIDDTFDTVLDFGTSIDDVSEDLFAVNDSLTLLKTNGQNLAEALQDVKDMVDSAKSQPSCVGCNTLDTTTLQMDADFDSLPDISSEVQQMEDAANQNLTATVNQAKEEFEEIPDRVQNESKTTIQEVKDMLNDFSQTINKQVENVEDIPGNFTKELDSFKADFDEYQDTAKSYDEYRWIAGVILTCMILVIVLLQIFGLMFGCLGHKGSALPSQRGCLSNCGGTMLMAATGFIFIFSWLLMLLTCITFLIGGNLEKLVCEPLMDPDYTAFKKLFDSPNSVFGPEKGYFAGKALLQNESVELTVSGILEGCRANGPAYTVLKLESLFDLETVTNYTKEIDIKSSIDNLDVDFSDLEILTPELRDQLRDFGDAVQLDYDGFRAELEKETTEADLATFSSDLSTAAGVSSDPAQTDLNEAATKLESIRTGIYKTVKDDQAKLLTKVNALENSTASVPTQVNDTLKSVEATETALRNNGSDTVKQEATNYADRILGIADSFASNTLNKVKHEVGRCLPVWNLWDSMIQISLCKYSIDSLNGFWFSLGWCLFFMVPSIIFNAKLAKYFRRMNTLETFDSTYPAGGVVNGTSANGKPSLPSVARNTSSTPASAHPPTHSPHHNHPPSSNPHHSSSPSPYNVTQGVKAAASSLLNNLSVTEPNQHRTHQLDTSNIQMSQITPREASASTGEHRVVYGGHSAGNGQGSNNIGENGNQFTNNHGIGHGLYPNGNQYGNDQGHLIDGVNGNDPNWNQYRYDHSLERAGRTGYSPNGNQYNNDGYVPNIAEHHLQEDSRYSTGENVGYPLQHQAYGYQYNNPTFEHGTDVQASPIHHGYPHDGHYNMGFVTDDHQRYLENYNNTEKHYNHGNQASSHLPPNITEDSGNYMDDYPVYAQVNKSNKMKKNVYDSHDTEEGGTLPRYEKAETQATEENTGGGMNTTGAADDSSQVVSGQGNDPISLLNTQPKSILKNKVTFDLPEQGAGSA